MNLDAIMQTFIVESREQLEAMESALLLVEKSDAPAEIVNSIFRSAHTIKGSAGLFSLDAIVDFTHVVESVLDGVRAGRVAISRDLVVLLLACRDHIGALIEAAAGGQRDIDPALA
ncbi:MAG: Hpt domain-containing protein, partial [Nevskia sp.]|nr:Hpt domain-containing protein [Nevskia sp.]